MEAEKHLCSGCGIQIPPSAINFKTRRAHCEFCGQNIIFPKKSSTASPNAVHALNEATKFFLQKNFDSAKSEAETVVSMVANNVPALYIIAYYNAFVAPVKKRDALDHLFNEVLPEAELEIEEEELFKDLVLKTILHTCDYHEQILSKIVEYDDPKEAAEFIEQFSPYVITKSANIEWFTKGVADKYRQLTRTADIPKTWYALLLSISKNPQSPLLTGDFYLKTKTANYYSHYVLPIGEILENISNAELKNKFVPVYKKTRAEYEQKMNG